MENIPEKMKIKFGRLPRNILKEIYECRLERMRVFMTFGLPEDIRWIVEAKVRFAGEFQEPSLDRFPGMGRSSYSKKRRAKRMEVCYKCARWTCDSRCRSVGFVSLNRADKILFIRDGLSKEPLDDIIQTLEAHPSGEVHNAILDLAKLFLLEKKRYYIEGEIMDGPVCQLFFKLEEEPMWYISCFQAMQ